MDTSGLATFGAMIPPQTPGHPWTVLDIYLLPEKDMLQPWWTTLCISLVVAQRTETILVTSQLSEYPHDAGIPFKIWAHRHRQDPVIA